MKDAKVKCLIIMVVITVIIWGAVPALADLPRPCDVCPFGCTYSSIQSAINAATNGDEIEVCDGTYVENIDFLGKDITVISRHGPSTTIIDGNRDDAVVTFAIGEGPGAVLSGFTIQNGSGHYTGFTHGGGIYIEGASPTITDCDISSNTAAYGGGIYLDSSSASISRCSIHHNSTSIYNGGGIFCTSSSPSITGCTFDTNYSRRDGAGIYCDSSNLSLVDTTLIDNWASFTRTGKGGGVALVDSSAVITGCTFSDNRAGDDGGGLWCNSDSTRCDRHWQYL